jgi:dUTP diphosphatase
LSKQEFLLGCLSDKDFIIKDGERICRMIIEKHERAECIEVEELKETEIGQSGFGHKGKH